MDYTYIEIESLENINTLHKFLDQAYEGIYIPFDTETTGLDPIKVRPLLASMNSQAGTVVLNLAKLSREFIVETFEPYLNTIKFIAHNAKYDFNIMYHNYGLEFEVVCTMVRDQKLSQGLGYDAASRPDGIRYDLSSTVMRHLNLPALDKDEQKKFVGFKGKEFTKSQLDYAAKDVEYLYPIMKAQEVLADSWGIKNIGIESHIISEVGIAECTGMKIDQERWIGVAEEKYLEIYEVSKQLDAIVKQAGLSVKRRGFIPLVDNLSLFGNSNWVDKYYNTKKGKSELDVLFKQGINYGSPIQVKVICDKLNYPLPIDGEDVYLIPRHKTLTNPKTKKIRFVPESSLSFITSKDHLDVMLNSIEHPNPEFIRLLSKYNSLRTLFATFGGKWLNKLRNGRIYTQYRTMTAITGRFQSGGGTNLPSKINIQNIPNSGDYRECFIADSDFSLVTADLSGAEVIILADKAKERIVYDRAVIEDDSHSPVAQYTWRDINLFRAGRAMGLWYDVEKFRAEKNNPALESFFKSHGTEEAKEFYRLSKELIISNSVNKPMRTKFKSSTFGGIYGMEFRKAAQTLNIDWDEARVALEAMKDCMPLCYEFVESQVRLAAKQGYVVLNKFGGSRITFPLTMALVEQGKNAYSSSDAIKEVKAVRNFPIQGTQADMIKLAISKIKTLKQEGSQVLFLLQAHDELVYRVPKNLDGVSSKWLANTSNGFEFSLTYERQASLENAIRFAKLYPSHIVSITVVGDRIDFKTSHSFVVPIVMLYTADLYLETFTMSSSLEVRDYWKK